MTGMRVLVLDGGGARGLFTLEVLRYIELSCRRPIRECFDLIVGTSIGAFIAGGIAAGKTIDSLEQEFLPVAGLLAKARPSLGSFATRLLYGHVLDPTEWTTRLQTLFGDTTLADLPESPRVLMLAADASTVIPHPFLIRNRPLPDTIAARSRFEGTTSMRLVDAFRAVTAAPTIYPAHVVNGTPLVDGGILANNPALFALAEANLLGPSLECIVSIGTGVETRIPHPSPDRGVLAWTWATIKRSTDPETPDMLLEGILPPSNYIRFDPPEAGDCSTWESDHETLQEWRIGVQDYMHTQQETLITLISQLCREKPAVEDNEDGSVSNTGGS